MDKEYYVFEIYFYFDYLSIKQNKLYHDILDDNKTMNSNDILNFEQKVKIFFCKMNKQEYFVKNCIGFYNNPKCNIYKNYSINSASITNETSTNDSTNILSASNTLNTLNEIIIIRYFIIFMYKNVKQNMGIFEFIICNKKNITVKLNYYDTITTYDSIQKCIESLNEFKSFNLFKLFFYNYFEKIKNIQYTLSKHYNIKIKESMYKINFSLSDYNYKTSPVNNQLYILIYYNYISVVKITNGIKNITKLNSINEIEQVDEIKKLKLTYSKSIKLNFKYFINVILSLFET